MANQKVPSRKKKKNEMSKNCSTNAKLYIPKYFKNLLVDTLVSTIDWRCFAYFDKEKYILEAKVTVN